MRKPVSKQWFCTNVTPELNNRAAFIDFCQGLLNLNPVTRWTPQQARLHPFITGEKFTKPFVVCPMYILSWIFVIFYCFDSQMVWQLHSTSPRLAAVGPIQNGLTVGWCLHNPKVQEHTQTRPHTTITLPSIKHTPLRLKLKLPTHCETLT